MKNMNKEHEQRKKDKIIHVTPEEAVKITGYDNEGYPTSQERKMDDEKKGEKRGEGGLLATLCAVM